MNPTSTAPTQPSSVAQAARRESSRPAEERSSFVSEIKPAILMLVLLSAITGIAYPLLVTLVAQVVFPWQANGSLVARDGSHVEAASTSSTGGAALAGSALIGQPFDDPSYFWSRISATTPASYNAASSSGSNLGPTNPALMDEVKARVAALRGAEASDEKLEIPVDLVTSSGSGLDPHISPAAAAWQIPRVAKARGLDASVVREIVERHVERRQLGLLGEPRVNVLLLNLDLDRSHPTSGAARTGK